MKFKDLSLSKKEAIGFGSILLLLSAANMHAIFRMDLIKNEIDDVTNNQLLSAIAISEMNYNTSALRMLQLQHSISTDEERKNELAEQMVLRIDKIHENQDTFEPLIVDPDAKTLYESFDDKWETYNDLGLQFLELSINNKNSEALQLLNGEAQQIFDALSIDLNRLVDINRRTSETAAVNVNESFKTIKLFARVLLAITIVVSIIIIYVLRKLITVPIRMLEKAAYKVAEGDLSVQLGVNSKDEVGKLTYSFNQMTSSLKIAKEKMDEQAEELRAQHDSLIKSNYDLAEKNYEIEQAIKQLKETQQKLVMSEKMASLGNLVAGVAHEINNPVGASNSAADVSSRAIEKIEKYFEEEKYHIDNKVKKVMNILRENNRVSITAGKRVAEIVKNLKNFARLEEAEFQTANLHDGINSTLLLANYELKNRVEVIKQYGDIPNVRCYPNQLNQVFMNVIINASQAIKEKGTITIATEHDPNNIIIKISDDGVGISDDDIKHIFNPGFTTKGVGVGTGLGLSICYNIIQDHKGEIFVESVVGKGTTVTMLIPKNLKA